MKLKKTMESFLEESFITNPTTLVVAKALNHKRLAGRSQYSNLITRMSTVFTRPENSLKTETVLILLASFQMPAELSALANADIDNFLAAWKDSILLMKGLWGTMH